MVRIILTGQNGCHRSILNIEKRAKEDSWEHTHIELIPLNKEDEPFTLEPNNDSFKVLGVLKRVIRK